MVVVPKGSGVAGTDRRGGDRSKETKEAPDSCAVIEEKRATVSATRTRRRCIDQPKNV